MSKPYRNYRKKQAPAGPRITGTFAGREIFYTSAALSVEKYREPVLFIGRELGYITFSLYSPQQHIIAAFRITWKDSN